MGKDKGRDDKPGVAIQDKLQQESPGDERKDFTTEEAELVLEKADILEDVSDVSDSADCLPEILQPDSEDRDTSPVNWDTDKWEVHPPTEATSSSGVSGLSSIVDDSSSTCSTDSVPPVVMNGPYKGNFLNQKNQKSPSWIQRGRATSDATGSANEAHSQPSEAMRDAAQPNGASGSCQAEVESEAVVLSLQDRIKELEQHVVKKVVYLSSNRISCEEEVVSLQTELSIKDQIDTERPSKDKPMTMPSSPNSSSKNQPYAIKVKSESKTPGAVDSVSVRKPSSDISQRAERVASPINSSHITPALKSDTHKNAAPKPIEKPSVQQVPTMSPSNMKSAPMVLPHSSKRIEPNLVKPSLSFGMVNVGKWFGNTLRDPGERS
ncbi:unnamed protein product [Camellia sinensis]